MLSLLLRTTHGLGTDGIGDTYIDVNDCDDDGFVKV